MDLSYLKITSNWYPRELLYDKTYKLTIYITNKLTTSEFEAPKTSRKGEKFEVIINFPSYAANAYSSWYEILIQPGRKCNFSYMYQGNGSSPPEIIYYQVVKR